MEARRRRYTRRKNKASCRRRIYRDLKDANRFHHGNQNMMQTHAPRRPPKRPGPIFLPKRLKRYATKCNTPKGAVLAPKMLFHHGSPETPIYTARKKATLRTSAAPRPKRRKTFPSWKKYRRRKKPRRPFKTPFGTPAAMPSGGEKKRPLRMGKTISIMEARRARRSRHLQVAPWR